MKSDTRSANVDLAAMKHRLAEFQQNAFERGTNYGVMLAMKAMGLNELAIDYDLINQLGQGGFQITERQDLNKTAWIFEIS